MLQYVLIGIIVSRLSHEQLQECSDVIGIAVKRDILAVCSSDGTVKIFRIE